MTLGKIHFRKEPCCCPASGSTLTFIFRARGKQPITSTQMKKKKIIFHDPKNVAIFSNSDIFSNLILIERREFINYPRINSHETQNS